MRATADPRRRRSPGDGATLVGVKRLRQILVSRPRQAPDGHKQGGTQSTNINMSNHRGYYLRLLHGSVSYDHITHSRSGPGPPTPNARGLDNGSHNSPRSHTLPTRRSSDLTRGGDAAPVMVQPSSALRGCDRSSCLDRGRHLTDTSKEVRKAQIST